MPEGYEEKFAGLIELIKKTKSGDIITIAIAEALGDSYDEIIESLYRIGDAEIHLVIVPRGFSPPQPHRDN